MVQSIRAGWRRGSKTAPLFLMAGLMLLLSACVATKSDVRKLQTDLALVQARQDSLASASSRQTVVLQDSIRASAELMRTMRGQLTNQIREVQDLLITVQQLLGQNDQRLAQLREQLDQQKQAVLQPPAATGAHDRINVDEIYQMGMARVDESPATARLAFEQILAEASQHERAPDAQYYLAETYYKEGNIERAYRELERVVELYPNAKRAPGALFRAGAIAEERKETQKARGYYTRVSTNYPNTDEARQASQALQRMRR